MLRIFFLITIALISLEAGICKRVLSVIGPEDVLDEDHIYIFNPETTLAVGSMNEGDLFLCQYGECKSVSTEEYIENQLKLLNNDNKQREIIVNLDGLKCIISVRNGEYSCSMLGTQLGDKVCQKLHDNVIDNLLNVASKYSQTLQLNV